MFAWDRPHQFDARDERIYTVLQQLAAPVVDAVRLFEQTQARTVELDFARREMDILYDTSRHLVQTSSPAELLDVISPYARERGAVSGHLLYFDDYQPNWIEVVAVWSRNEVHRLPMGWRLAIGHRSLGRYWLARPEQPTLVPDIETSDFVGEDSRMILGQYGVRGFAALPLHHKERWIAVVYYFWANPIKFDTRDERIFAAILQHAAPVIDSLRLLDQSRARTKALEQLNQEVNLLYRSSEIINSASSYQEIVEAVAPFDPDAEVVTLMLWDTLDWHTARDLIVEVVIDRTGRSVLTAGIHLPKGDFPIARVMMGERVWLFEDALSDPRIDEVTAKNWAALDIRSFMGPALYINQQWCGGITFHSSKPRKFTERENRLLAGIGDLVMAAIQRIRSQQETQAAKEEIDALYRVGEAINAANSYAELVQALSGIISGATAVALYIWENWDFDTATYVEQVASTGYLIPRDGQRTVKSAITYAQMYQGEHIFVIEDVSADTRLDDITVAEYRELALLAAISIRLYVNQRWIGSLVFNSDVARSFSERERRLAAGLGDYVLGAVERIRAREESEAARQRAEAFAVQAQQLAVLEERNRLARELHDSVSQALYGIVLGAQTARTFLDRNPQQSIEPLDYVLALSEAGLAEMRALIFELRPETLEKEGLVEALSKQVTMLQARHGLDVRCAFGPEPDIPIQLKEALYWIAREALHNVVKHANASSVNLSVACTPDSLLLSIEDDGAGFNVEGDFSGHLGLKSMSERASGIGGTLHIHSDAAAGTQIQLHLPLATARA